jgi:hypothetical protein
LGITIKQFGPGFPDAFLGPLSSILKSKIKNQKSKIKNRLTDEAQGLDRGPTVALFFCN